nr:hypothetical protein [Tanacetum cinerariifolium]
MGSSGSGGEGLGNKDRRVVERWREIRGCNSDFESWGKTGSLSVIRLIARPVPVVNNFAYMAIPALVVDV